VGQEVKGQGDVTCAKKIAKLSIIQPGIARFRSNFVQTGDVMLDVLRTFKVKGQGHSIT